jgi:hypothetical protein
MPSTSFPYSSSSLYVQTKLFKMIALVYLTCMLTVAAQEDFSATSGTTGTTTAAIASVADVYAGVSMSGTRNTGRKAVEQGRSAVASATNIHRALQGGVRFVTKDEFGSAFCASDVQTFGTDPYRSFTSE